MITILYTIPKTQYDDEDGKSTRRKLPNSKVLNTLKTRCLCEAMVNNVEVVIDAYYDETILGAWQPNGLPIGYDYVTTTTDDVSTTTIELTTYPIDEGVEVTPPIRTVVFNKATYIKYLPNVITYDDDGVVLTNTKQTKVKFLHNWAGWKDKVLL